MYEELAIALQFLVAMSPHDTHHDASWYKFSIYFGLSERRKQKRNYGFVLCAQKIQAAVKEY